MIKNLLTAAIIVLAINFIAIGGGVGWLWSSHHLDKDKVAAIKAVLFPPPTTAPTTQPAAVPAPAAVDSSQRLEALLARQSGHSAAEQMDFMRHTFDQQMAELDRRERELGDLKRQTDMAQEKLTSDRSALDAEQKTLAANQQQAAALASDKGFQDSLQLYTTMQPRQVKSVFSGLDDATVTNYLRAMEPAKAAKIIKEFKSPEETARIEKIMERIRQSPPATSPANGTSTASAAP